MELDTFGDVWGTLSNRSPRACFLEVGILRSFLPSQTFSAPESAWWVGSRSSWNGGIPLEDWRQYAISIRLLQGR